MNKCKYCLSKNIHKHEHDIGKYIHVWYICYDCNQKTQYGIIVKIGDKTN